MTNKIPQEIEEKILKDVFDDLWDENWNQNKEEAIMMIKQAISLSFKAVQKQSEDAFKERIEDLIVDINSFNIDLAKDNTIWRLNGEELNDLWEDYIVKKLELLSKIGDVHSQQGKSGVKRKSEVSADTSNLNSKEEK